MEDINNNDNINEYEIDYYNIHMVKVDVSHGIYGKNIFYVMQLVYDNVKKIYVLFNRWGRIGHHGQWQMTPYNELDEAKKEFEKIFNTKTGNQWINRNKFIKKEKKW